MRRFISSQLAEVLIGLAPRQPRLAGLAKALGWYLAKTGRLSELPLVRFALRAKLESLGLVTIETARPLGQAVEEQVRQQLTRSHPERLVTFAVKERLGTGFRIVRSGRVLDASLAGTLQRLKLQLETKHGG